MRLKKLAVILGVVALLGAACNGDDDNGDGDDGATTVPAEETTTTVAGPDDPAAAEEEIRANFEAAFASDTPPEESALLIEDVELIADLLAEAAGGVENLNAEITNVTFTSDTTADVTFTLNSGDQALLQNQQGRAVLVDGTWKVSFQTMCDLLALQGLTCPAQDGADGTGDDTTDDTGDGTTDDTEEETEGEE